MIPSCLASVSSAAEQAFDCLLIYIEIPTANYLHRSHFSAESHILLSGVTFHSESQISLHKITSHAGGQAFQGLPPERLHLKHSWSP